MLDWQLPPELEIPAEFVAAVRACKPTVNGKYAARLLWQRGLRDISQLPGYLNSDNYPPTSPFEFGSEMTAAVERLKRAHIFGEKVTIWGDFDADGVTATSVLWDGLGQFFTPREQLDYYIPNRMKESHGLNIAGIKRLANQGTNLIVTCDTGSTNIKEVEYAAKLGIDVIITDHHTLPLQRPPVAAIINPRYFEVNHPLFHLSGVAVAYKLVEALYATLPDLPQQPVEYLLDLVAIGLIADLVQLKGDCRYLAQQGIKRLTLQNQADIAGFRPGVHQLLKLCKRNGDRPTDISFGIAPRINAISRIHGDASFGVELLTSKDVDRCHDLSAETELANTRRKELQKNTIAQVQKKLAEIDLSTTSVIVLVDSNWSPGVLGLVAGQIAQEHGKPTILLSTTNDDLDKGKVKVARGSARSTQNIDLYQLVNSQAHLLNSFGGHPFAAGMSINVDRIPLFAEAIDQQLHASMGEIPAPSIATDLVITCADLKVTDGRELFDDLLLLEPYGMGNPVPKLLIKNCQFKDVKNKNIKDFKGNTVQYIRTKFQIVDDTDRSGFPGIWWGHYEHEIPQVNCDAIVELDFNSYDKRWEVRLIEVRPAVTQNRSNINSHQKSLKILDFRRAKIDPDLTASEAIVWVKKCPGEWSELQAYCREAVRTNSKLALDYQTTNLTTSQEILQQLVGIAKYLATTSEEIKFNRLKSKLEISDRVLRLGLDVLVEIGFGISLQQETDLLKINSAQPNAPAVDLYSLSTVQQFFAAIKAEQFKHNYFLQVPASAIEAGLGASG
jgi:single-stranded-DNA-specific exonuclease